MIRDLSKRDRKGQALYVGARPRNGRWTQQQGFTLIELMITLAISAILLSVAAPAYQSFIGSTALTTATNDLVATSGSDQGVTRRHILSTVSMPRRSNPVLRVRAVISHSLNRLI